MPYHQTLSKQAMENVSTYPDSVNSSPRSRDVDDAQSLDDLNYKVKFMCSYAGKIQPRPHDNQLAYIGGDTKILAVDRNIRFNQFMAKLSSLCGDHQICFKYQLPGEDLDALISVTNDEDLDHMMIEYDRLGRGSAKMARLRLFIFRLNPTSFGSGEVKSDREWFVDALNSVQVQSDSAAVTAVPAPDFLFGLDNKVAAEVIGKDMTGGSDCGSDVTGESNGLNQDTQMAPSQEQVMLNSRGYAMEYYNQKVPERVSHAPVPPHPVQMPIPASFFPERHVVSAPYNPVPGAEQPVYIIPSSTAAYQQQPGFRPVTGQVGQQQGYYGVQRLVPEVYREQPVYSAVPPNIPAVSVQGQQKVGVYSEGIGMVQPVQVGYDSAGRQVYYTAPYSVAPSQPVVVGDGKVVAGSGKAPQTSSM